MPSAGGSDGVRAADDRNPSGVFVAAAAIAFWTVQSLELFAIVTKASGCRQLLRHRLTAADRLNAFQ